jgi:hypothetical protein
MAQVVKHLSDKYKILSSNPCTAIEREEIKSEKKRTKKIVRIKNLKHNYLAYKLVGYVDPNYRYVSFFKLHVNMFLINVIL